MKANQNAENFFNKRASLYQRVFIGLLNWGNQLENFFRKTNYLQPNIKILDAGCGTGAVTETLHQIAHEKGYTGIQFFGFDLSENMLNIFQQWVDSAKADNISIAKADVLNPNSLPAGWNSFDLIITSTMFEYLPRNKVKDALSNLKDRLKTDGTIVVIITKRNLLTAWVAGKWWKGNLYKKTEIKQAFVDAGFEKIEFRKFTFAWSNFIIVIEGRK